MSRVYFNQLTFFAVFIIFLLGCNKNHHNDKCLSYTKAPVTKIEGAGAASVNQEVDLTVSFGCFSGCGQFGNFKEIITGSVTTININAKYEGCICTTDAPTRKTLYKFKRSQPGTNELKFQVSTNNYLTHTITVQ